MFASGGDDYEWSTGDTTQIIEVCPQADTIFYVTISNESGCSVEDSVIVSVVPSPNAYAGQDTSACQGECIILWQQGVILTFGQQAIQHKP